MFTGLIELVGRVSGIEERDTSSEGGGGWTITISDASEILGDCHNGDSIAVNGTCLTVTSFTENSFKVGLAPETLNRTNLGSLTVGSKVNLERAMLPNTRLGGHLVQGHVDTTATIVSSTPDGNSLRLTFSFPSGTSEIPSIAPYLIPKGYITLDGASLTLTAVSPPERTFSVMLVSYTQGKITLPSKNVGDKVNVEVDMVGKYVERSVEALFADEAADDGEEGEGKVRALEGFVERAVERVLERKGLTGKAAYVLGR